MNHSLHNKIRAVAISAAMLTGTLATPTMLAFSNVYAADKTISVNKSYTCKEGDNTYTVNTASLCGSGETLTSITCVFEAPISSGSFSGGLGIGVTKDYSPEYWYQGESFKQSFTSSTFTVVYEIPKEVQPYVNTTATTNIGMYYCGNSATTGSVKLISVTGNTSGSSTTDPTKPESTARKSGTCSFVDNKDGTATISSTLTASVEDLDITLTQGYDEDYYLDAETGESTYKEGDPLNSHKITYKDFGISDLSDLTLESFTFILESDSDMGTVMYGGGMNVAAQSPADTEYINGKEGFWYNDHGPEDETDYGFEIGRGTTLDSVGKYQEVTWEMPETVRENATTAGNDAVSIQYWYGDNESIKLTGATCTYTQTVTVPYTGTATAKPNVKLTAGDDTTNAAHIDLADLDLTNNDTIQAIKFTVSAGTDIGKFVGAFGISVDETLDETMWYQGNNFVIQDAGKNIEIMWILTPTVKNNVNVEYGNTMLGFWYGNDADTITLDSVDVYYYSEPEVTTTTTTTATTTTPTTTTTTEPAPIASLYGDVDCNGKVEINDVVLLSRYVAQDATAKAPSADGLLNADCYYDGTIDSGDITAIARYLAHLIDASELGPQA